MSDSASALTKQGIARQQAGDIPGAMQFFTQAIQADPAYEMAWLWLSSCLSTPGEKRYCLDQALAANPQSAPAAKGLAQLGDIRAVRPIALGGDAPIAPPPELMGAPVAPAKKSLSNIAIIAVVAVVLIAVWLINLASNSANPAALPQATKHTITYELTAQTLISAQEYAAAKTSVNLTYTNPTGAIMQGQVLTPWTLTFQAENGRVVSFTARKQDILAIVKCRILIDGTEVQTAETGEGQGIITCGGTI